MFGFIAGMIVGGMVATVLICALVVGKRADERDGVR